MYVKGTKNKFPSMFFLFHFEQIFSLKIFRNSREKKYFSLTHPWRDLILIRQMCMLTKTIEINVYGEYSLCILKGRLVIATGAEDAFPKNFPQKFSVFRALVPKKKKSAAACCVAACCDAACSCAA